MQRLVQFGDPVTDAADRAERRGPLRRIEGIEQQIARFFHFGEAGTQQIYSGVGIAALCRKTTADTKPRRVERAQRMLKGKIYQYAAKLIGAVPLTQI